MSESIWKFPVQLADEFEIELDVDAEVLSVQNQPGLGPQMWVRTRVYDVPQRYRNYKRKFYVHGTGHTVNPNAGRFLGTLQFQDGALIFHVFEEKR